MSDLRTLKDIEAAIEMLTPQEYAELRGWFDQYDRPQAIDLQLEADLGAGKSTTAYAVRLRNIRPEERSRSR
jgi:hypothetical protein